MPALSSQALHEALKHSQVLLLSDYAKGTLADPQPLIQAARAVAMPVLVDPKGSEFDRYRGATLLTPNQAEFEQVAGRCADEAELIGKARAMTARLDQDRNWEEIRRMFEDLHPDFVPSLKQQFPDLSKAEVRLAALYKMELSKEEMIEFLAISPDSFKMARYRLRKKLGVDDEDSLKTILRDL